MATTLTTFLQQAQKDAQSNNITLRDWLLSLIYNGGGSGGGTNILEQAIYADFRELDLAGHAIASSLTAPFNIVGWNIINPNPYPVYVKYYDTPTPTIGTTAYNLVLMIPSNGSVYQEANSVQYNILVACYASVSKGLPYTDTEDVDSPVYVYTKIKD